MLRLVRVSGQSMAPTLRPADLLLTSRGRRGWPGARGWGARSVRRGDVVVLRRGGVRMVKRVVALAGDLVELEAGRLFVGGRSVDWRARVAGAQVQAWRVPPGHVFVAGDNAAASDDSRVWAEPYVPLPDVDARVLARLPRLRGPRRAHRTPAPSPRELSPRRAAPAARPAA